MDSMGATLMTDMSLFYESDVTVPSVYGAPMTSRTMTVDASGQKEVDRRRAAWMVAAQAGDRAAYETLLRDCIPFIKQVARGQGIRPDLIDDAVQETLLTVHRARQTYDPNRSFTAWLRTIAQRRAIDVLRRVGRTRTREVYAPLAYENHSDPSGATEETAFHIDHTEVLSSAVGKLSARQRQAVEHLAFRSQSLAQAATITGRSTGSLRVDWHRALKTLYARLGGKN
jgi:RNA polymerase sigma factor (sigma-70 family)